jgi:hypothetical protein
MASSIEQTPASGGKFRKVWYVFMTRQVSHHDNISAGAGSNPIRRGAFTAKTWGTALFLRFILSLPFILSRLSSFSCIQPRASVSASKSPLEFASFDRIVFVQTPGSQGLKWFGPTARRLSVDHA